MNKGIEPSGQALKLPMNNRDEQAVRGVIERRIGKEQARLFRIEFIDQDTGRDVFELESDGGIIVIRGSGGIAATSGFNWYLKHVCHCHFSWCGENMTLPHPLPQVPGRMRRVSPFYQRYYLNYCTYSYSMAFWGWERWEQEIDWMALNGINLALSLVGQEEVMRRTLIKLGYTEDESRAYICGPAFLAWQWMQNLTSWGGPLPGWWFREQGELGRRIHERMLSLGIMPIIQGFNGAIPCDFQEKYPDSAPLSLDNWAHFQRPSLLLPEDPYFEQVSSVFYREQQELFGTDIHYYSTDPFHESTEAAGIDLTPYARDVQAAMLRHDDQAVWVLQQWQANPRREFIEGLKPEHALVLDLWCESNPNWNQKKAFYGTPWLWCVIQNFGGKNGLYGNLQTLAHDPLAALNHPDSGNMAGVGLAMEGIDTNPVTYDLMTDMFWRSEAPQLEDWLNSYLKRRYGQALPQAEEAWRLLQRGIYNCQVPRQEGAVESIICARPAEEIANVSSWGPGKYYYNFEDVRKASRLLFECYDQLRGADGYLYDLVDVTRQALADLARDYHKDLIRAFRSRDAQALDVSAGRFLQLVRDQDRLLGTRKEFLLGRWIERAVQRGRSEEEQALFAFNARTLITLWGPKQAAETLRDYSHREWAGLIADFYYRRWAMYIDSLKVALALGEAPSAIDWYEWEYAWTKEAGSFATEPQGDLHAIMTDIIGRYLQPGI